MNWRKNIDSVYDLVSKSLIICYFALLVSIVFLMVLDVIPTDVDVLNYGEIISSIVLIIVTLLSSVNEFYAQLRIPHIAIFQLNLLRYYIKDNTFRRFSP